MSRTCVVWVPDWPVVAGPAPLTTPAAVIEAGRVLACSSAARERGVRRGMRRRDAQACCTELVLLERDAEAEAREFEQVLTTLEELVAGVWPLRPGLCAVRVPPRAPGGEPGVAALIAERLVDLGVWDVRSGVADDLFTAQQAARRAPIQEAFVVAPGASAAFLAELPVEALEDPDLTGLLRRLGLRTLGAFARLSVADVRTRFGEHGVTLHRKARGQATRPIARREVPTDFTAALTLEPSLARIEPIVLSLRGTAEAFVSGLADADLVCTAVCLEVDTDQAVVSSRVWRHPQWFTADDLLDRLRWQLAGAPPESPVDAVRLVPEVVEPLGDHADALFGAGSDARIERVVARVQSIVGHESVVTAGVQGGRAPLDRTRTVPWGQHGRVPLRREQPWPGHIPAPAPATVYRAPVPARVLGAQGQPVGVSDRGAVVGEPARFRTDRAQPWRQVAAWAGPWPVDEQWWDELKGRRIARFQVVGVDGSAWLLVVEGSQWWTEARYD